MADTLEQRQRLCSGGHDVAVDLEGDIDTSIVRRCRKTADAFEEGRFVLVLARVPTDRGVHDGDAIVRAPLDGLDAKLDALGSRQVRVCAEHRQVETVVRKTRT